MKTLPILLLCIVLCQDLVLCRRQRHASSMAALYNSIFGPEDDDEAMAMKHTQRVSDYGNCDLPKIQVIHVSDYYPIPGKYYLPHCTLLHRCGKHAGCCGTERLSCVAAEKEKIILHFYSVRVVGNGIAAERSIEKLAFTNHTKCGCVPNEDMNSDL